jgi:hypothetical protein
MIVVFLHVGNDASYNALCTQTNLLPGENALAFQKLAHFNEVHEVRTENEAEGSKKTRGT